MSGMPERYNPFEKTSLKEIKTKAAFYLKDMACLVQFQKVYGADLDAVTWLYGYLMSNPGPFLPTLQSFQKFMQVFAKISKHKAWLLQYAVVDHKDHFFKSMRDIHTFKELFPTAPMAMAKLLEYIQVNIGKFFQSSDDLAFFGTLFFEQLSTLRPWLLKQVQAKPNIFLKGVFSSAGPYDLKPFKSILGENLEAMAWLLDYVKKNKAVILKGQSAFMHFKEIFAETPEAMAWLLSLVQADFRILTMSPSWQPQPLNLTLFAALFKDHAPAKSWLLDDLQRHPVKFSPFIPLLPGFKMLFDIGDTPQDMADFLKGIDNTDQKSVLTGLYLETLSPESEHEFIEAQTRAERWSKARSAWSTAVALYQSREQRPGTHGAGAGASAAGPAPQ